MALAIHSIMSIDSTATFPLRMMVLTGTCLAHHKEGKDGDHLTTPFQCDLCWFRNLQHRDPNPDLTKDTLLLCCIRRATLDAVWGREPQTVSATLRTAKQMIRLWDKVGMQPQFMPLGPFPVCDS
jgi:hypothetical protein